MGWKTKVGVVLVLHLCLVFGILYYSRTAPAISEGTSNDFWYAAVRVSPGGFQSFPSSIYQTHDEWFVYYHQGFHGQFLHRVSRDVALANFSEVVKRLETANSGQVRPHILDAFQDWKRQDPGHTDADLLIQLVADYRLAQYLRDEAKRDGEKIDWKAYFEQDQKAFELRYARIQRYWLNVVCESIYLSFLIFFALWPWLRSKGLVAWGIHIGALPFLLFLPHYLGYATLCFTSAGPVGGAFYPHLLVIFRESMIGWSELDVWVYRNMPHPLSELSQTTGPMLSLSGGGGIGPVGALMVGSVVGAAIALFPYADRYARQICARIRRMPSPIRRREGE